MIKRGFEAATIGDKLSDFRIEQDAAIEAEVAATAAETASCKRLIEVGFLIW